MIDIKHKELRDDPVAYVIAGDEAEEAGDDVRARVLRRQGETLCAILAHFGDFGGVWHMGGRTKVELPCGAHLICVNKHKIIRARLYMPSIFVGTPATKLFMVLEMTIHKGDLAKKPGYLARRVRDLFRPLLLGDLFELP